MFRIAVALVVIATIYAFSPTRDAAMRDAAIRDAAIPGLDRGEAALESWRALPEEVRDALAREALRNLGPNRQGREHID